jgi:hypothetical protein
VIRHRYFLLIAAVATLACDGREAIRTAEASAPDSATLARRAEADRARQDSIVRARPGYIIDSILPVEEEIRRFQATIPARPTAFTNAAPTRSELVKQFVRALERNDTTALRRLVIDRGEFGYLVYPTSPNVAPPYRQSPDLVWLLRSASSDKGREPAISADSAASRLDTRGSRVPARGPSGGKYTLVQLCGEAGHHGGRQCAPPHVRRDRRPRGTVQVPCR